MLLGLPDLAELLDRLQDEALLINGELAVLAKGIQHHNVLFLDTSEWTAFNLFPLAFFLIEDVAGGQCLLLACIEALIVLILFFILCFELLLDLKHICNCLLKCLIKQAAIVAEGHRHEGAKSWNFLKEDSWFPDYLGNVDMSKSVDDVLFLNGLILFLAFGIFFFGICLA